MTDTHHTTGDAGLAIDPPPFTSLPIVGEGARFPVARIFCVGRNYADHAREMGADPEREAPFFFMKQPSAIVADGAAMPYPALTGNLHHEVELVVAIGLGGSAIVVGAALDHVFGYAVGIDMTRRDLQDEAKAKRRPWDVSKSFDAAAPTGAVTRATAAAPGDATIALAVDGAPRQSGRIADMIWSVPEIIAALSRYQALAPGDLIFTGTPSGVGPVAAGQRLTATIDGLAPLEVEITPAH